MMTHTQMSNSEIPLLTPYAYKWKREAWKTSMYSGHFSRVRLLSVVIPPQTQGLALTSVTITCTIHTSVYKWGIRDCWYSMHLHYPPSYCNQWLGISGHRRRAADRQYCGQMEDLAKWSLPWFTAMSPSVMRDRCVCVRVCVCYVI